MRNRIIARGGSWVYGADETPLAPGALTGADFDLSMCRFATMNYLLSTGLPFNSPASVKAGNSLADAEQNVPTVIVCNPPFKSTAPLPEGRTICG